MPRGGTRRRSGFSLDARGGASSGTSPTSRKGGADGLRRLRRAGPRPKGAVPPPRHLARGPRGRVPGLGLKGRHAKANVVVTPLRLEALPEGRPAGPAVIG